MKEAFFIVPRVGFEPTRGKTPSDFKSLAYSIPPPRLKSF